MMAYRFVAGFSSSSSPGVVGSKAEIALTSAFADVYHP